MTVLIILLTVPLYIVALFCHEFAHAFAGRFLGGTVTHVNLGGHDLAKAHRTFHLFGFECHFYGTAGFGLVNMHFKDPRSYRLNYMLGYAAGPAFNLAAILLSIIIWKFVPAVSVIPLISWGAVNFVQFVISGIPAEPNDGFQIAKIYALTDDEVQQRCAMSHLIDKQREMEEVTLDELIARNKANPDQIEHLESICIKLNLTADPRLTDYVERFTTHPQFRLTDSSAMWIDTYLKLQLVNGKIKEARNSRYDQLSLQLLEQEKNAASRCTRGSVLIDLGKMEEGIAILENVVTAVPLDLLFTHTFLAVAEEKRGNLETALFHAGKAYCIYFESISLSPQKITEQWQTSREHLLKMISVVHRMKFDLDKLNSLYQSTPDNVDLLQVLVIKLQQAQDSRYGELLQTLVEHPEARPAQWGYLLHAYLREKLLSGDIQKSPDDRYDELSKILVKVRKNSLPAQVTRGSILIDLGDFEEGKEMLNKVLAKSSSRTDRLYSHTFIGLAEERLGNLVAARRRAKKAMALAPNDPILSRLGAHLKEMPEPQESGKT